MSPCISGRTLYNCYGNFALYYFDILICKHLKNAQHGVSFNEHRLVSSKLAFKSRKSSQIIKVVDFTFFYILKFISRLAKACILQGNTTKTYFESFRDYFTNNMASFHRLCFRNFHRNSMDYLPLHSYSRTPQKYSPQQDRWCSIERIR